MGTEIAQFGALAPDRLDRAVLALTGSLPAGRLGLRVAIWLRRIVMMRLAHPDGALDVERWGVRVRLHPRDNICEKILLFTPQMFDPVELAELGAELAAARSGGETFVFVDAGANVGLFSLFVAAQAGPAARILAIEPEPGTLQRLEFNIRANSNVNIGVVPVALGGGTGHAAIELDRRDRGGSRASEISGDRPLAGRTRVLSRPLLDVLSTENVDKVDALKIDVEGSEDVILGPYFRDAPESLWPGLIIIEDSRAKWKVDLMSMLSAKGYAVSARSRLNFILRRGGARACAPERLGRNPGSAACAPGTKR